MIDWEIVGAWTLNVTYVNLKKIQEALFLRCFVFGSSNIKSYDAGQSNVLFLFAWPG